MAKSGRTNVLCVHEKDFISDLPSQLQETILNCLPILDVVRTSKLSKEWRYCWTKIPDLIFGQSFCSYMDEKLSMYNDDPHSKAQAFLKVIHDVLQLHNGPILRFKLGFLEGLSAQTVTDYINDQLIPLLSAKGVKKLVLKDLRSGGPVYSLELDKFSSSNLTHLVLLKLKLQPAPAFGNFSCLTQLYLADIIADLDDQYIFRCPLLEILMLSDCFWIFHTNFNAPKLKHLYEKNLAMPLSGLEKITIFYFVLRVPNITLQYNVSELIASLLNIEELFIHQYSIQYLAAGGSPNTNTKPLLFLKTLTVTGANLADVSVLSCLVCLIRSAPNLSKLQISALTPNDSDDFTEDVFPLKDWKDCTTGIQTVVLRNFKGLGAEMQLLKFLLAHCPLLERMVIRMNAEIDQDTALTMQEAMGEFPTLSPTVQVSYFVYRNGSV